MSTTIIKTSKTPIYEWDNVDWDYPSCGGSIGTVYADGRVEIERISNIVGQRSGLVEVYQLHVDDLSVIADDPDTDYNGYNTYDMMLKSDGIAYISDYVNVVKRGHIVR